MIMENELFEHRIAMLERGLESINLELKETIKDLHGLNISHQRIQVEMTGINNNNGAIGIQKEHEKRIVALEKSHSVHELITTSKDKLSYFALIISSASIIITAIFSILYLIK